MYVVIGYKDHGYDGYGSPIFCSKVFDSSEDAYDFAANLPEKNKGYDILYQVLEVDGEFLDQW